MTVTTPTASPTTVDASRLAGDALDARTARRTVPRATPEGDAPPGDAVDPEVWALHVRYQRTRDEGDLAALVEEYRAYAASLARRMYREGVPIEDLRQVAMEALVTALQRFDCERGIPFCGLATPTILGALKRHYRDQGWAIRIPRSLQDLAVPARRTSDRLAASLGRTPRPQEVADELGVDVEVLSQLDRAVEARRTSSLDSPIYEGGAPIEVGTRDRDLDLVVDLTAVKEAVTVLDDRSREVLGFYYFEELTQSEIAARYDVSQMQVSRWIRSALARLRAQLAAG